MTGRLEDNGDGHVEEEEYSRVDVNGPVVAGVKVELVGGGAVSRDDDVLQTKEPGREETEGHS